MYKGYRSGVYVMCPICGNKHYRYPSTSDRKCCSKKCSNQMISRMYKGDENRAKHLGEARKKRDYSSLESRINLSRSIRKSFDEGRSKTRRGIDSNLWRGGVSSEQNRLRNLGKYKRWREAILLRDGGKCVDCGSSEKIHAHHIKSFSDFENLRFEISNGKTLCVKCHGKEHGRVLQDIGSVNRK